MSGMSNSNGEQNERAATLKLRNLRVRFRAKLAHLKLPNTSFEHDIANRMALVGIDNHFVVSFISRTIKID